MKNCPPCGKSITAKKKTKTIQETKIENGITYYGKIVNYSTGPKMAWATFPDNGKSHKKNISIPNKPLTSSYHLKGEIMVFKNDQ